LDDRVRRDVPPDHIGDLHGRAGDLPYGLGQANDQQRLLYVPVLHGVLHGHLLDVVLQLPHAGIQLVDLLGYVAVVVKQGRVGEVHHQLGCVLDLQQHLLQGPHHDPS